MTQRYATRNGFYLNLREKFEQLELYKLLLANGSRFVYYEQTGDEGNVQGKRRNISKTWTKRIAPFRAEGKPDLSSHTNSPFI